MQRVKVVKRSEKFYTLDINGHKDTVSLDRLKPAYLEDAPEPTTSEPSPATSTHSNDTPPTLTHSTSHNSPPAQRTTRFGRHVRWPKQLDLQLQSFVSSLEGEYCSNAKTCIHKNIQISVERRAMWYQYVEDSPDCYFFCCVL